MWAACCEYVSRLVDPFAFEDAMEGYLARGEKLDQKCKAGHPFCVCRGRYSYEHWELSHPRAHVISTAAPRIFGAGLEVSLAGKTSTRDDKSMNACVQGVKGTQELKSIPRFGSLR